MVNVEEGVSQHYSAYDVLSRIRAGLETLGRDPDHIEPGDLKQVDEFHIGGGEATAALLADLAIQPGMEVLDIGCGIGGPARTIAQRYGGRVTGIDLTPAFVHAAEALSRMAGMEGRVDFKVGSAVALPFADETFDVATLMHVGMNIPDKTALFAEAYRVLRRGGVFAVYDVMRTGEGELAYPVPWAEHARLSALETPDRYRKAAADAGFTLEDEKDRRGVALEFFERVRSQAAGSTPGPLGLHLLMGPTVGQKVANMINAIQTGTISPLQMVFRKS
jgi:SAM-dependent methyltransferase